jgi:hypothetical protein
VGHEPVAGSAGGMGCGFGLRRALPVSSCGKGSRPSWWWQHGIEWSKSSGGMREA